MITSLHNPKIRWARRLLQDRRLRKEENLSVIEGVRMAEEALLSGWEGRLVLYTDVLNQRGKAVVEGFRGKTTVEEISPGLMKAISETETPQGLLVVLELQELQLPPALDFVLIPDGVRDPGNLGTMLRVAAAAGVQAVLIPPETADPFAPKVLRAAMGAHFRLPTRILDWQEIEYFIDDFSLNLFLAVTNQGIPYTAADFTRSLALVIGGEASGLSEKARNLVNPAQVDRQVHIPMPGNMESLNAASATSILLFEVVRQRSLELH